MTRLVVDAVDGWAVDGGARANRKSYAHNLEPEDEAALAVEAAALAKLRFCPARSSWRWVTLGHSESQAENPGAIPVTRSTR